MSKTLDLIRNAKDGSYVDFRTADNQIDSVPIDEIRALLDDDGDLFIPDANNLPTLQYQDLVSDLPASHSGARITNLKVSNITARED